MTGELVGQQGTIDPQYWSKLNFIQSPLCTTCGSPFPHEMEQDMLCGACLQEPPSFTTARSALRYDDASSAMILKFKHADGTTLAPALSHFLAQTGHDMLAQADVIIPVPLHRWRLFKRRYNQAMLLANLVSRKSGIPVLPHGLRRTRSTPSQGKKSRSERLENIKNAFSISEKHRDHIQSKRIVLVDDVHTSGATINECTRILLRNGAARVDVLTLARVVTN